MALGSVCRSFRRTCATYAEACAPMVRSGASPSGPSSTASAMVNPFSVSTGARCRAGIETVCQQEQCGALLKKTYQHV